MSLVCWSVQRSRKIVPIDNACWGKCCKNRTNGPDVRWNNQGVSTDANANYCGAILRDVFQLSNNSTNRLWLGIVSVLHISPPEKTIAYQNDPVKGFF